MMVPLAFSTGRPTNDRPSGLVRKGARHLRLASNPAATPPLRALPEDADGRRTSMYWRVPDPLQYLTAIAAHPTDSLCAVASGATRDNLFIYELEPCIARKPIVTHHQTISLGEIHSLCWASPRTELGAQGNVLVSGHKSGIVHMTLLPDTYSSDVPAEILKRFNHIRHLPATTSTRVKQVALTGPEWNCCTPSSIASLCCEHFFLWDPTRSDLPLLKHKYPGIAAFDLCATRNAVLATGGRKGIAIRDLRVREGAGLMPRGGHGPCSHVRWSPSDGNVVAAVHDQSTIKIWDIRAHSPLATYAGHIDQVTSTEWLDSCHLVSSSNDGTIRVWDSRDPPAGLDDDVKGGGKLRWQASDYGMLVARRNLDQELDRLVLDIFDESEPAAAIVGKNKQFTAMALSAAGPVSIDTDGYFGVHTLSELPHSPLSSAYESSDNDFIPPLTP